MTPLSQLGDQTALFVRQLQERRKLEKNLLVERVRGTKEGAESVVADMKSRVAMLEKLSGSSSASSLPPIGPSQPFGTGYDRASLVCQRVPDAQYARLAANPYYLECMGGDKSAQARVGANPSLWDTLGYVHVGYVTPLEVPSVSEVAMVLITSRLNTLLHWAEVNALGAEWYAQVSATARLWVTYDGDFRQAPPVSFVNLLASPTQVRTHQDMPSCAPAVAQTIRLFLHPSGGTTMTVHESVELTATTPNGHAYLDGVFAWERLLVQWEKD